LNFINDKLNPKQRKLKICDNYEQNYKSINNYTTGSILTDVSSDQHVQSISKSSYSTDLRLSSALLTELLSAATTLPLVIKGHTNTFTLQELKSNGMDLRVTLATVFNSSDLKSIQKIAADQEILEVVTAYLGFQPKEVSSWLFWSFVNNTSPLQREANGQTVHFHYDVHGYNFMYVNFYLLDTDANNGAHTLISGSHCQKKLAHLLGSACLSDEAAVRFYGEDRVTVISGKAGTGFFEDTSCFHKALPPQQGDRLMLQLRYS
jgi:hypothetical protein